MVAIRRLSGRKIFIVIGAFGLIVIGLIAWQVSTLIFPPKLEIGPETTFVSEPLTSDGRVDFIAAIHQRMSAGVTPEDNAAVLIDRAFGPAMISPELQQRYFQWMGTESLLELGDYFISSYEFIKRKVKSMDVPAALSETEREELKRSRLEMETMLEASFSRAQQQPWNRPDYPLVAEWLDANSGPISLIEQAAKRSNYYSPFLTIQGSIDSTQGLRQAARILAIRAMFRLGQNDPVQAWDDLLSCHRLAQLVSQRAPATISYLTAIALDGVAARGDASLMAHGLSYEQARTFLSEYSKLPLFVPFAEVLDQRERIVVIDLLLQQVFAGPDVNLMLRRTNRMLDELVSAMKESRDVVRKELFAAIDNELKQKITESQKPLRLAVNLSTRPGKALAESFADVLFQTFLQSCIQEHSAQTRHDVRRDLVLIGFALTAYRAEKGAYPESLDELVPKYLDELPLDRFSEKPFIYVPRENGFLIYSVGANGHDDEGRMGSNGKEDDVAFEVPPNIEE